MNIDFAFETNTGHVRASNQDTVGCFPEHGLFLVADGMGGHQHGERASRMAIEEILKHYAPATNGADGQRLVSAIEKANQSIHSAGASATGRKSMGTTIVALAIDSTTGAAAWAHVGDSRLYRHRSGTLELLTADHTRHGFPYREQGPTPIDLTHTNQLMAALGIAPTVQVSTGGEPLAVGDRLLLCSDGVSGMLPPEAIRTFLGNQEDAGATASRLIASSLQAGGRDNATAIVLQID